MGCGASIPSNNSQILQNNQNQIQPNSPKKQRSKSLSAREGEPRRRDSENNSGDSQNSEQKNKRVKICKSERRKKNLSKLIFYNFLGFNIVISKDLKKFEGVILPKKFELKGDKIEKLNNNFISFKKKEKKQA